ncbi:MAG: hypothetical protein AAGH42_08870 [Pseudomonadota bacterium]
MSTPQQPDAKPAPKPTPPAPAREAGSSKPGNWGNIASFTALVVSCLALAVSILEVSTIRTHQRSSVWPFVSIEQDYSSEGYAIALRNKGIGPARMHEVIMTLDGKPYGELDRLILDAVGKEDAFSYDVYSGRNPANSVIAAGSAVTLFSVPWDPRTERLVQAWTDRVNVETCFCSIYDQCWRTDLNDNQPKEVKACPGPVAASR